MKRFPIEIEIPEQPARAAHGQTEVYAGASGDQGGKIRVAALTRMDIDIESVLDQVEAFLSSAASRFLPGPNGPQEVTMELGVKIGADGRIVFAKIGSEVNFALTVKWSREPSKNDAPI